MGGNNFDYLTRLDSEDYFKLEYKIMTDLANTGVKSYAIQAYKNKPSFGDMDLVVKNDYVPKISDFLKEYTEPRQVTSKTNHLVERVKRNGNIISFAYPVNDCASEYFQVDLILTASQDINASLFYFSYNDLNNLVGRIAHKFGLKFGWDGLVYQFRNESGHKTYKLNITRDPKEIYKFLNLDYNRYLQGFDELEDVFDFVVSSKYFSKDIFALENLNHINKRRNEKRKTYMSFLEWLNEQSDLNDYKYSKDKSVYLIKIHNYFREIDLLGKFKSHAESMRTGDEIHEKFNGNIVMTLTGLKGKELGVFLAKFTNSFYGLFNEFILTNNQETINNHILDFYNNEHR